MPAKLQHRYFKVTAALALVAAVVLFSFVSAGYNSAHAQQIPTPEPNPYFSLSQTVLADGTSLERMVISGPPVPPPGFEAERAPVDLSQINPLSSRILTVPTYSWVYGCSAVSGAMVAGYYDRSGYAKMYTGPTGGGLMPLNNGGWPTWSDGDRIYPSNPLVASRNGLDGRTTRGSIDDYWIKYGSITNDPFITNGWPQHAYGTAIGDYMWTSQSSFGNSDGATSFWGYTTSPAPLTCDEMAAANLDDGTLGRRKFYEARGYTVTTCYNQKTDNTAAGGFSFAQFKAEIDAGRPVLLNLAGHSIVGVGYDDTSSQTVYLNDTWDFNRHVMTWGGSYAGMQLLSVSVVNLDKPEFVISGNAGAAGVTLSYTDGTPKTVTANSTGHYAIKVPLGWSGKITPFKMGVPGFFPVFRTYKNVTANQPAQNYAPNKSAMILSSAAQDGVVLESKETSGVGGWVKPAEQFLSVGDDAKNRQYRAILSFNTSILPDNAVIVSASLRLAGQQGLGQNPFLTHSYLLVDLRKGVFGASGALGLDDFAAVPTMAEVARIKPMQINSTALLFTRYDGLFSPAGRALINKTGRTQLRLRFALDDNNDLSADTIDFLSANSTLPGSQPVLQVIYYVP